jgi:hypothetical protein
MEFEMKHERASNWQFPIHWMENGANDTNEMTRGEQNAEEFSG